MSIFEPWVGKRIGEFSPPKLPNLNRSQFEAQEEPAAQPEPDKVQAREKPTPANTGAPTPGYRKRGPITPQSTGAPVPGTNKPTGKLPVKHTRAYPKKIKGTAPGTRPKKK